MVIQVRTRAKGDDALVGFWTLHIDPRNLTLAPSLIVGEEAELHRQMGRETGLALFGWAFEKAGLEKVIIQVAETNRIVADWVGSIYQLEGRLRDEVRAEDGSRVTILRFGLLRAEWSTSKERGLARLAERLNNAS